MGWPAGRATALLFAGSLLAGLTVAVGSGTAPAVIGAALGWLALMNGVSRG